jgi:hypothetical protein
MPYQQFVDDLVPLETFSPDALRQNKKFPQEMCDLVIALALAYNDFRDIFFAHILLDEVKSEEQNIPNTKNAFDNGLRNTIVRMQIGIIRELLVLIKNNNETICQPTFKKLHSKLSKKGKNAWDALYNAATDQKSDHPLYKTLIIIRNKVAFHYDAHELGRGYQSAFFGTTRYYKPLLSRGTKLRNTRFYFADAAAHAYISSKTTDTNLLDFFNTNGELMESINRALYEIVTCFIQSQAAWEEYK